MSASNYLEQKLLDHVLGGPDFTRPATVYLTLHKATSLSANANAGQNQIQTGFDVPVGTTVVINPGGATQETKTVSSKSGAGPYTLTLNSNLAQSHTSGEAVKFDPLDDGTGMNEPSGGAFARASVTNNDTNFPAATSPGGVGTKKNGALITFPQATADWGTVTHWAMYDADPAGNLLYKGEIKSGGAAVVRSVLNGDQPRFLVNGLVLTCD